MVLSLLSRLFCVALVSQLCNSQRCTTQNAENCVFPFEYENKIYRACSTEIVKPGKSWCSLSVDGNGEHRKGRIGETWGLCSADCPVHDGSKTTSLAPRQAPVIDEECPEGTQCSNVNDCPDYLEFKNSRKGKNHPDYQKWKASVCNKKEKRLCCPIVTTNIELCEENPEFDRDYLPRFGIDQCGKNCIAPTKVSGGVNVKLGEFPWAALLGYKVVKRRWDYKCRCQKLDVITAYRCGGTLINNWYVLTAAHCHEGNNKISSVVLGEWEVGSDPDCPDGEGECLPPKQSMEVERVIKHENYFNNIRTGEVLNDIALIRLKQPVIFNKGVQPICLPLNENKAAKDINATNLFDGIVDRDATVIGWGANGSFHAQAKIGKETVSQQILQKVDIPIISNEDCKSQLLALNQENVDKKILPTHVCAGQNDNKDSCKGDSGGGMFVKKITSADSIYHQIGLVSFGLSGSLCGIGYSGVYTRITEFIPWIKQNIRD